MVTLDRIRLTGLLKRSPANAGLLYVVPDLRASPCIRTSTIAFTEAFPSSPRRSLRDAFDGVWGAHGFSPDMPACSVRRGPSCEQGVSRQEFRHRSSDRPGGLDLQEMTYAFDLALLDVRK